MRVTAEVKIHNDQDHQVKAFTVESMPNGAKACPIVYLQIDGNVYEVSASDLINAIVRVSGELRG